MAFTTIPPMYHTQCSRGQPDPRVEAKHRLLWQAESEEAEDLSLYPLSDKEYRFQSFASCEFNGQIYMTPQDFLESVTEENPRPRIGRFKLTESQVQNMLKNTPNKKKSTKDLFRSIMDKGILSYTEYLFLLCILTKPRAGYEIAFKMFDRDGNQRIDRKEFLLMEEIFRKKSQSSSELDTVSGLSRYAADPDSACLSAILSALKINETTLLRYFFGPKGTDTLDYKTFSS
ncbi:calcium uptake protein 3, mitochondrial-like, partial [Diadema antillarum]|uniref:calcium uptake protein 3, mitochondrial-like n=1 Tax=Diadema antillarum TaxID=105358 RepID=UPI003A8B51D1